jgi:glycerol-3-phosphate dehydrogenase
MAEDTIDHVVTEVLGADVVHRIMKRSRTRRLSLRGAEGYGELLDASAPVSTAVPAPVVAHLAERYGGEARTVIAMIEKDARLGEPLVPGLPYVRAEAVYAARYEMARSVDDVLSRRTRARLLARDASARAAADVASLLADDLGWDSDDQAGQAADYRAIVARERDSADLPEIVADVVGA